MLSSHGKRRQGRYFWVRYSRVISKASVDEPNFARSDSHEHEETFISYAVSSKVANAVIRNRIRRRIKAALMEPQVASQITPGLFMIGVKTPKVATISFADLCEDLAVVLTRCASTARSKDGTSNGNYSAQSTAENTVPSRAVVPKLSGKAVQ